MCSFASLEGGAFYIITVGVFYFLVDSKAIFTGLAFNLYDCSISLGGFIVFVVATFYRVSKGSSLTLVAKCLSNSSIEVNIDALASSDATNV